MKIFHYCHGAKSKQTMTVSELIDALSQYPNDMPVIPTYESVTGCFEPDEISVRKGYHTGVKTEACDVLLIDVERY